MRKLNGEKGQSMVEFALLLPLLILLLCGIIDFGWLFSNMIAEDNACREAARYAAVHYYTEDQTTLQDNAKNIVEKNLPCVYPDLKVTVTPSDASNPDSVTVSVSETVPFLTAFTSTILNKSGQNLSYESIMRIEQ